MARINNINKYKQTELDNDSILLGSKSPNGETVNYNIVDIALFVAGYIGDIEVGIQSIQAGDNITVDNTDPKNPIISSTGGGGTSIHNELTGIQGGSPNEYYHFNEIQHEKLLSLIYTNGTSTISVSPSSGERGVNAALTVNYNITSNDDVFGTATINQGIGDVTGDIDTGNQSKSGGNSTVNKSFTMSLSYTRNGEPKTENKTATYNTYIPQWAGWSAEEDFSNSYSSINSEANFQKYIQSSASINKASSPTGEYIWFISNKNNATIKDTNDFVQTVGTWGDGTSEFYRKPLTLTLADGVTTATVYLYRSRNVKTLSSFTYKIS